MLISTSGIQSRSKLAFCWILGLLVSITASEWDLRREDVRYFPNGHFPGGDVPSNNFPSGSSPKIRLSLLRRRREQWGPSSASMMVSWPSATAKQTMGTERCGKLALGKLHSWKVATWENTLEKLPLGKVPLRSCHLGKNPWEVSA